MYHVLLVDDDMTNRIGIRSLLDWEELGFDVVGAVENGKAALEFLETATVHLIITDMKMPIMGGIRLISEIRKINNTIQIIAVSSYSDFDLVREGFKYGIEDYLLKTELNPESLKKLVLKVKKKLQESNIIENVTKEELFRDMVMNNRKSVPPLLEDYYCLVVKVADAGTAQSSFSHAEREMAATIRKIIMQIPRIANHSFIIEYSGASLLICYRSGRIRTEQIYSFGLRLMQVIKTYMNVDVYIGVSDWSRGEDRLNDCIYQAEQRMSVRHIFGKNSIFTEDSVEGFRWSEALANQEKYRGILQAFKMLDGEKMLECQSDIFNSQICTSLDGTKKTCMELLYFESLFLEEIGDSIQRLWGGIDFNEKLSRLDESSTMMMWIANYNRWLMDYLQNKYGGSHREKYIGTDGSVETVIYYLKDNYRDPSLNLTDAASIVGLNEKYFSVKFKKETGITFVEYLTDIRMEAAKKLLKNTNMRLADISDAVGYKSVEHFGRSFKKRVGMTPREYERERHSRMNNL